jgi:hypothetical protein
MKKIITIALILILVFAANAQDIFNKGRYLDTIRIEGEKINIEFLYKYQPEKINTKKEWAEIDLNNTISILNNLKIFLAEHKSEIEVYDPVEIILQRSHLNQSVSFRKAEPQEEYYAEGGYLNKIKHQNVLKMDIFVNRPIFLTVRFSNVSDLIEFDFTKALQQLGGQSLKTHWYPESFEFEYKNDILEPHLRIGPFQMITDTYLSSIDFNTGLSLFKQKPTIDFGIGINLAISREQMNYVCLLQRFCLSYRYTTHYDDVSQKARFNGFIYGLYTMNFPRTNRWLGVEAGYLLHRQGDFFDNNTVKVALVFTGGKIDFSPGVFISSKSVIPCLSIAFTGW